jgi:polar amino acid transport system permease protein
MVDLMSDLGDPHHSAPAIAGSDEPPPDTSPPSWGGRNDTIPWWDRFPFWAVIIAAVILYMGYLVAFDEDYNTAYDRVIPGIWITLRATVSTFTIACVLGLLLGLMRVSNSAVLRAVSRSWVEFIRGIPILVLIFTFALVIVPELSKAVGVENRISSEWRAIIALALIYSGYIAEIFRAGFQSVDRGQVEAGRSLGLTRGQTTRSIVMPQAVRAMIPPLGNDFIAVLKDTSLLSVLGVAEVTQRARQFSASTFRNRDYYFATAFIYLVLTVTLSLLVGLVERRVTRDRRGAR